MARINAPSFLRNPVTAMPFLVLAALSLNQILYIVPYYNWFYRIGIGLFGTLLLLLSPLAALILFANTLYHRRWRQMLLTLAWAFVIFLTWWYIVPIRVSITTGLIQTFFCREGYVGEERTILGGIQRMGYTFVNDSHCIFPNCTEEFYYCDR